MHGSPSIFHFTCVKKFQYSTPFLPVLAKNSVMSLESGLNWFRMILQARPLQGHDALMTSCLTCFHLLASGFIKSGLSTMSISSKNMSCFPLVKVVISWSSQLCPQSLSTCLGGLCRTTISELKQGHCMGFQLPPLHELLVSSLHGLSQYLHT